MLLTLLKSKIRCARVTEANLHYMGSITVDSALMEAAGLVAGEQVHVVNNSNRSEERRVGKECRSRWSPYH